MLAPNGKGSTAGNSQPVKEQAESAANSIANLESVKFDLIRFASWLAVIARRLA
jgi:hypothetical protein